MSMSEQERGEWEELFLHPGFKRLCVELRDWRESLQASTLNTVRSMDDIWRNRGRIEALELTLGRETAFKNQLIAEIPADETNPQED